MPGEESITLSRNNGTPSIINDIRKDNPDAGIRSSAIALQQFFRSGVVPRFPAYKEHLPNDCTDRFLRPEHAPGRRMGGPRLHVERSHETFARS
jgi:hypothetical protein